MSNQTISELNGTDRQRLDDQRQVAKRFLDQDGLEKYQTTAGKLGTLRAILEAEIFDASQTYELQSLGIVLGDAIVQEMGFHWVMVEDEHGRDPAIKFEDTSIIVFPMTMISKRMERNELVDVFDLFNGLADYLTDLIENEEVDKWV